jgi:hypothetical protein
VSFHVSVGHLHVFLERIAIQVICPFLKNGLFIFEQLLILYFYINSLSDMYFANIFSHSASCLFIYLVVSFAGQSLTCLTCRDLLLLPGFLVAYLLSHKNLC